MKRFLLFLTIVALVLPAVPRAHADDMSVDFFYNNLSGGNWIEVGDYGYCWQPDVAANDSNWRPYSDGYWTYTDLGWTWVSYEDFGWATYHYGRWARLSDYGWVWVPGSDSELEWGPAWVSWRTGGDYIGWAPLPPRGHVVYEDRPITSQVDVEFDIGPSCYNFIDVRYIGEPVLRERIIERSQNVTYVNQTVNVTNITHKNKVVFNFGPDFNVVSARSSRPIQRLKLERQSNVDFSVAAKSGAMTKVEGDRLVVGAPLTIRKSAKQFAPPTVKVKVAQAKLDHGWSGVSDPKAQEQLKKKMQTEDSKKIPPPTGGASRAVQAAGSASPVVSASPAASNTPGTVASVAPATSASPAVSASPFGKGKGKSKFEQLQPGASVAPGASAVPTMAPQLGKPSKEQKGKFDRGNLGATPSPGESSTKTNLNSSKSNIYKSTTPSPSENAAEMPKDKGKRLPTGAENVKPSYKTISPSPGETSEPKDKGKAKQIEPAGTSNAGSAQSTGSGQDMRRKVEGASVPPTNVPSTAATGAPVERSQGKPQVGKGKKIESASPSPSP